MISGTKFRGDFEERIQKFLEEAEKKEDVILFLDELHTIMGAGAGASDALDAANILKPVLARGSLRIIGATTRNEYRRHIEKDAALERRFQPVSVEEPDVEGAVEILRGLRSGTRNSTALPSQTRRYRRRQSCQTAISRIVSCRIKPLTFWMKRRPGYGQRV